jgi:hypothetical protein
LFSMTNVQCWEQRCAVVQWLQAIFCCCDHVGVTSMYLRTAASVVHGDNGVGLHTWHVITHWSQCCSQRQWSWHWMWAYTLDTLLRTGHKEGRVLCKRCSSSWRPRTAAWCGRYFPTGVTSAGFSWWRGRFPTAVYIMY